MSKHFLYILIGSNTIRENTWLVKFEMGWVFLRISKF